MTYWEFTGRELVNCTCEYGCNCQFNGLPDKGHCHAVAGIHQVPRQESTAAPHFEHQPVARQHRFEQLEDSGRAQVGMEPEAPMVHEREIGSVVRLVHSASSNASATAASASGASITSSRSQEPMPITGTPVRSANAISERVP